MYSYGPPHMAKQNQDDQLCEDMGCNPEDLPKAMNDRKKWRERVRDIRASGTTWWWWWLNLISCVFVASSHVKEHLFCVMVEAEVRSNFSFAQERCFFQALVVPTSCQEPQGTSALLELILFYLFSFFSFLITTCLPTNPATPAYSNIYSLLKGW